MRVVKGQSRLSREAVDPHPWQYCRPGWMGAEQSDLVGDTPPSLQRD